MAQSGGTKMGVWKRVRNIKRYYVDSAWEVIAGAYADSNVTRNLIEFDNKLYAGENPNGRLLEWSGGDEWTVVADMLSSQIQTRIIEFDSKIYAGTSHGGMLFEWNSTGEEWLKVADTLSSQDNIRSLAVHDGALYGGTDPDGMLFKWDIGSTTWVMVADSFSTIAGEKWIYSLIEYDGVLYGGTLGPESDTKAMLLSSTGGAWTILAVADDPTQDSFWGSSLAQYNGKIYMGTYDRGNLLEHTIGSTTLTRKAGALYEGRLSIEELIVFDGNLYGGTGHSDINGGKLFKWNDVDTWVQVADQVNGNKYITGIVDLNGVLYASASLKAQLLKFVDR